MWISAEFKIYLIKEFQRLKDEEYKQLDWDIRRNLAKINYRIHTDAIKENLIPPELTKAQISLIYASEADVLNMALFGMTCAHAHSRSGATPIPAKKGISGIMRKFLNLYVFPILKTLMRTLSMTAYPKQNALSN